MKKLHVMTKTEPLEHTSPAEFLKSLMAGDGTPVHVLNLVSSIHTAVVRRSLPVLVLYA